MSLCVSAALITQYKTSLVTAVLSVDLSNHRTHWYTLRRQSSQSVSCHLPDVFRFHTVHTYPGLYEISEAVITWGVLAAVVWGDQRGGHVCIMGGGARIPADIVHASI